MNVAKCLGSIDLGSLPTTSPWGNYDFAKPSRGVIASNGEGNGVVLWAVGGPLRYAMEEEGGESLVDLGLDNAPLGISIWEGTYEEDRRGSGDPEDDYFVAQPHGTFRLPTEEEWEAIRTNACPWNDEDWKLKKESLNVR